MKVILTPTKEHGICDGIHARVFDGDNVKDILVPFPIVELKSRYQQTPVVWEVLGEIEIERIAQLAIEMANK